VKIFYFLFFALPLVGQQEGSVAIAGKIPAPASMNDFTGCVAQLAERGIKADAAAKNCHAAMKTMADATKKVANEAADATKASRPRIIWGGYGYGYGRYYYSGGYYYRRPMVYHRRPSYHRPNHNRSRR
jgi:hypothetical protein